MSSVGLSGNVMEILPYTTSWTVKEMLKFHDHWKCAEMWNFCKIYIDFPMPEMQLFFLWYIVRVGCPRNLGILLQEFGRAGRKEGMVANGLLLFNEYIDDKAIYCYFYFSDHPPTLQCLTTWNSSLLRVFAIILLFWLLKLSFM